MTQTTTTGTAEAQRLSPQARQLRASPVRTLVRAPAGPGSLSLSGGWPAPEAIDHEGLAACALHLHARGDLLQYGATHGEASLQEALRDWAGTTLDLSLPAHELVVTSGAQQALDLIARVILSPGDAVAVEGPTYPAALACLRLAGADLVQLPSDAEGLDVDALEHLLARRPLRALYLVPTHGNPSGATLARARRERLAELSARHRFYVIEDDPYQLLGFDDRRERPIATHAAALDRGAPWVLYVSSLSKIVAPGLRVGWVTAPADVAAAIDQLKACADIHSSRPGQALADAYLRSGRLHAALPRIRALYRSRCDALALAFDRHLAPLGCRRSQPGGGLFLWVRLPAVIDATDLLADVQARGLNFVPGHVFFAAGAPRNTLRLAFSGLDAGDADRAARLIAQALVQRLAD